TRLALDFQQHGSIGDWPVALSVAVYRTVQEALTNIMRHAAATAATVHLEERDGQVLLTVADDGHYTDDARLTPGFGLKGIMERSHAVGGSFALSQNRPHGLIVRVVLPLDAPAGRGTADARASAASGPAPSAILA